MSVHWRKADFPDTVINLARRLKVTLPIRYAVLDHEEPLPPSGMRSSAVALQDHQRSVVRRRRDEMRTLRLRSSRAPRGRARRMCRRQGSH